MLKYVNKVINYQEENKEKIKFAPISNLQRVDSANIVNNENEKLTLKKLCKHFIKENSFEIFIDSFIIKSLAIEIKQNKEYK